MPPTSATRTTAVLAILAIVWVCTPTRPPSAVNSRSATWLSCWRRAGRRGQPRWRRGGRPACPSAPAGARLPREMHDRRLGELPFLTSDQPVQPRDADAWPPRSLLLANAAARQLGGHVGQVAHDVRPDGGRPGRRRLIQVATAAAAGGHRRVEACAMDQAAMRHGQRVPTRTAKPASRSLVSTSSSWNSARCSSGRDRSPCGRACTWTTRVWGSMIQYSRASRRL